MYPSAMSTGASSLFSRVVISLPSAVGRTEAVCGRGFLVCIFDEKILERGTRRAEDKPNELHPERRVDRFFRPRIDDGPRPILNLARDALEHQPQFC